jgi:hypothetical protein
MKTGCVQVGCLLPRAGPVRTGLRTVARHLLQARVYARGQRAAHRAALLSCDARAERADHLWQYVKAGVLSGNFWLTKGLFCQ